MLVEMCDMRHGSDFDPKHALMLEFVAPRDALAG